MTKMKRPSVGIRGMINCIVVLVSSNVAAHSGVNEVVFKAEKNGPRTIGTIINITP